MAQDQVLTNQNRALHLIIDQSEHSIALDYYIRDTVSGQHQLRSLLQSKDWVLWPGVDLGAWPVHCQQVLTNQITALLTTTDQSEHSNTLFY